MPPSRPRLGTSLESTAPSRLQVLVGLTSWNCSFDYATERPVIEEQNVGIGEAKRWDRDRKCTLPPTAVFSGRAATVGSPRRKMNS